MFNHPVFWDAIAVDDLSWDVNDFKGPWTALVLRRDRGLLDDISLFHKLSFFLKKGREVIPAQPSPQGDNGNQHPLCRLSPRRSSLHVHA